MRVVDKLHFKLGLNKYHQTFASIEKYRPDLLNLKAYVEGLQQEEDQLDSLERNHWVRNKLSIIPNIYEFLRERDTSKIDKTAIAAQKEQFKKARLQAKLL